MNIALAYIFIFVFGAIIGSFLNVVILRYNTGRSIVKESSACLACGCKLKWHELVPIASFFAQKGRCANCKSKISWQYPIVETFSGVLLLMIFLKFQSSAYWILPTGYYFIIFSLLTVIAVYDFRHQIIPNNLVYLFAGLAFLNLFAPRLNKIRDMGFGNLKSASGSFDTGGFLAGIAFFSFFALIWFLSKGKAMGLGDAKLAMGIGWLLGFSAGFSAMLFSFWIGALAGILLLILQKGRYNLKSRIAFGPFLAAGSLIAFWVGNIISLSI